MVLAVCCWFENHYSALAGERGGGHTFAATGKPELVDVPDDAKDVLRVNLLEAFLAARDLEDGEARTVGDEDLLLSIAQEVAGNGVLGGRRLLHRQGVQRHGGKARHGVQGGRGPRRRDDVSRAVACASSALEHSTTALWQVLQRAGRWRRADSAIGAGCWCCGDGQVEGAEQAKILELHRQPDQPAPTRLAALANRRLPPHQKVKKISRPSLEHSSPPRYSEPT